MDALAALASSFDCTRVARAKPEVVAHQCEHAVADCLSGHCPECPACCKDPCCKDAHASTELQMPRQQPTRYPLAGLSSCSLHEDDMINRLSLESVQARQLRSLERAIGQPVRLCPFCGNACFKEDEDDCDHIFCVCGREFCFQCLADREVILQHGNHYHRPHCKFFCDFQQCKPEFKPECRQCKANGVACTPPGASRGSMARRSSGSVGGS
jgi:hypothetical protein